ncbi:uncharacterized protein LOC110610575 isoform X3 [Manihot esculenta]|uniref:Inner centromere protein ARK-binding domain-containing protein n=2 Tax=Manihot esculenta TaxID=3983 RepID=A0A2C9W7J7_MANES|nr:uncharacterized protein LOC110610575 isoform X3 [Manihot esculenta]OAY55273.1 hypothetical protein MANES_03G141700v8 [Manihot esculenta]
MTTIEKLFVQIFERKKRIIEQVKQQTDLFEQHLASKCILDGVAPPSWLWSPSFPSLSSDPNELKKEELIPGLLLPRPQPANPYSSTHDSLCQKPVVTSGYKGLQNVSCTEVHASNIGTTADDGMSVLPPLPTIDTQCTFNGVSEPDCSIASPQDCVDTTTADNCLDHAQSLVKIQRSKSRQRALELRNSAKATKSHSCNENDAIVFASQDIGCGISSLRFDHFDEVELVKPVDRSTVDRSTECCEEEAEIGKCAGENSSRGNRSGSSSPKITSVNKPENDDNSSHFAKDDGHKKSMNELPQNHNHVNALSELDNSAVLAKANCFAETVTLVDFRGNEMNNTVLSDRITGSRSSIYRASASKNPFVDISSCVEEDGGHIESVDKSAKQHSSVSELLKLVKPLSAVPNDIYGSRKAKARNRLMKRKGSDIFVGRITRSRSSSLKPNCVNKYLEMDNSCCNGKEDGVSNPKQLLNHDNDSRDLVNTLGTTCASPELKAETLNFQNVDAYCQRLTSSSSNEKPRDIREFPKVDLSSNVIKDGDSKPAESFGKSSQLPQQSSFVEGGGATLQFLSDSQPNVLPCTKSNPAETDMDYDGLVVACSVSSESDSDGRGCVVENLELRPPSECDMPIKPKQLNFDDVKESNFLETSSLALEHKQEGTSEKQLSTMLQPMDLGKVTSIGYQGNPNPSIEMPLLEEQEFSNKEKSWKVSIEGHMKDGAVLADESTINPLQKKMDPFFSQNQNADSYFMGSWPQHKRIKIEGELTKALSASPSLKIGDALQANEGRVPLKDMHQNAEHEKIEEYEVSSSQLQVEEIEISSEGRGRTASTAFNLMLEQVAPLVSSFKELAGGEVTGQHPTEEKVSFQHEDKLEVGVDEILTYNEDIVLERKDHLDQNDNLSYCSTGSHCQSVICADQSMPEFQGFVLEADYEQPCTSKEATHFGKLDLPPTGLGCASVLEQFCTSTSQHTPLLDFSSTHKLHKALNLYHSIPNGLLEDIQLRSTLYMQVDRNEQLGNSFSCFKQEVNHALHGRSHSVSLPFSNPQSAWDVRKPGVSPLGKLWDGIPPKSSSSGKRVSSIPELPCISEENENTDGVADTTMEGTIPEVIISSVKRQPLADITKNSNPSEAEVKDDRSSLASLNTELSFSGTCGRARPKLRNQNKNKRRFTNKDKENDNLPREGDGPKRGNGSLHGRFSKPKLSGKTDLIKGGLGLSEKESKRNNIVSNVTSFIPLVQQKQAAAVITGKRDIKVKALEAAEAAKRLAEKKENERKMKKEALKLERARMEEQNLRQLELDKKKKEQKKKEADMAAKKKQREDEDRKERERKRKRVEEGKRHQLEQEKKLRMLKEQKEDERAHEKKEYKDRLGKHDQIEKAEGDQNLRTVPHMESTTTKVSTSGTINASIIPEDSEALSDCGDNSKVTDYFGKDSDSLISNLRREQSYEISPYKGSDDEDEDDDDNRPNSKFIPSWASKSHLARVISSQQKYPESIFPPESFCSISEVLLPRKLQQK